MRIEDRTAAALAALFLLMAAQPARAQLPVSAGIKAGRPLTEFFSLASGRTPFESDPRRYIIGPMFELNLPGRASIELDALYIPFNYRQSGTTSALRASGNAWEFPLLLKFRFSDGLVRPYLAAGVAFNRITGLKRVDDFLSPAGTPITSTTTSDPEELRNRTGTGVVLGAGIEVKALVLRVSPEIRFTRWGVANIRDASGLLRSQQNQAQVLVGFSF
ncbi:MAG: outer membrane beta-barrel protein [Bryobacteraceae bacterium]